MPKNTAQIGKADERMIVKDLEKLGYKARRQPGSGNRAVDLQGDVVWLDSPQGRIGIEAKYRQDCAWKTLETWRAGQDILTVRCDARKGDQNGQRMVFMSWELFLDLVGPGVDDTGDYIVSLQENVLTPENKTKPKRKIQSQGFQSECPECHKYVGKCPACHRTRPKIASQGFQKGHRPMRRA